MFPRRAYLLLLSGVLVVSLAHCSSDISGPLAPGIVAVSLTPPTATLRVGAIVQLTPTVTVDGSTAVRDVSYISSDPIVVDVSPSGLLRALNVGTAKITAIVGDTSATVTVTVIAGLPVSVVKRVGDEQTAPAGSMVAIPPAVTVLDSAGNPVSGVGVTFKGTGTIAGVAATTNDIGVAVVTTWTLAPTAGLNTLTATVAGLEAVTFNATGTAATIGLSATSLSATSAAGSSGAIVRSVNATNTGTGALSALALGAISFAGAPGWLTATIAAGTAPAGITLTANPAGLAVGTYTATVTVSAANAQNGPQSIVFTLTVTQAVTATTLTSSTNPSAFGTPVTLTAAVTALGLVPTGTVQFSDGGVPLGAPIALAAGTAALTTSSLSLTGSPHVLTAEYSGDANSAGSTSVALNEVVRVASTSVTLSSSASTGTFGSPVTFTATVTGSGGVPTGTIEFRDGATVMGSSALSAGVATLTTSVLTIGSSPHVVTAVYRGDASNGGSTSATLAQGVTSGAPSVATLTSSASPSAFGQSLTFMAVIAGPGGTPTGTVTFREGSTVLGTSALNAGVGTIVVPTLSVAGSPHAVTAQYSGDATYGASVSGALAQNVVVATTVTAVASNAPSAAAGQLVTFTATVTNQVGAAATGSVTLSDGGSAIGTAPLSGGVATFSTSALSASVTPHSIVGVYTGDANNAASTSAPLAQVVSPASVSVALASSLNPSPFASAVTFTATVAGSQGMPTGKVTFKDGATTMGTVALNNSGVATLASSVLTVDDSPHSITAFYAGDGSFLPAASPSVAQVVARTSTTTTLSSSAATSTFGQAVTFTATVNSAGGTPSGTVAFKDGTVTLGSSSLSGGTASLTTSALSANGSAHSVTAVYGGASSFNGSASTALAQVVSVASSATTLTSSVNPSVVGQAVTFTAVVAQPSGSPTGRVTFMDGETTFGSGVVDAIGVATFSSSTLAVGTHSVTGVYSGDGSYGGSTSGALSQSIGKATPTITVSSPATTSPFGSPVTFTVRIAGGATAPSGLVTLKDGGTDLSGAIALSGGVATFTTAALTVAGSPHAVTAVYSGDASYLATTSAATMVTVSPVETTVTLSRTIEDHPSLPGVSVTFLAIITLDSALAERPTGTMQFRNRAVNVGAPVPVSQHGAATLTMLLSAGAGPHTITAVYSGDKNYQPGTSNSIVQGP